MSTTITEQIDITKRITKLFNKFGEPSVVVADITALTLTLGEDSFQESLDFAVATLQYMNQNLTFPNSESEQEWITGYQHIIELWNSTAF